MKKRNTKPSKLRTEEDSLLREDINKQKEKSNNYQTNIYLIIIAIIFIIGFLMIPQIKQRIKVRQKSINHIECHPLSDEERINYILIPNNLTEYGMINLYGGKEDVKKLIYQGFAFRWDYNIKESFETFNKAIDLDPECIICHLGMAYTLSPFLNIVPGIKNSYYTVYSKEILDNARFFISNAKELYDKKIDKNELENKFINALELLHPDLEELSSGVFYFYEILYAKVMLDIYLNYSNQTDLLTLTMAAEAFLQLSAWNHYETDYVFDKKQALQSNWNDLIRDHYNNLRNGQERVQNFRMIFKLYFGDETINQMIFDKFQIPNDKIETDFIAQDNLRLSGRIAEVLLYHILNKRPDFIFANHLYIHLTEAAHPGLEGNKGADLGLPSANNLFKSKEVTKLGHLKHVASHIYARTGDYDLAIETNIKAVEIDINNSNRCVTPYIPEHNVKVLVHAARIAGNYEIAEKYAEYIMNIKEHIVKQDYIGKGANIIDLLQTWVYFAKWDKILSFLIPLTKTRGDSSYAGNEYATVYLHFARAMAYINKVNDSTFGRNINYSSAKKEYRKMRDAMLNQPDDIITHPGPSPGLYYPGYRKLARIALFQLQAKFALLSEDKESAIIKMNYALDIEKSYGYVEPTRVLIPIRQCLGYVYLLNSDFTEAEMIYKEDLKEYPLNPWSTLGLKQVYAAMGSSNNNNKREDLNEKYMDNLRKLDIKTSCPMLE